MTAAATVTDSRVILRNVPWQTYEALLDARADDPAPRITYDKGTLEIMSPSGSHEWLKTLLGRFIETFTLETGIRVRSAGSTTLKSQLKEKGLEPDESYYVQNEGVLRGKHDIDLTIDPPPDLAIEIDISRSSLNKLGIYASLGMPEVWTHDERGVVVYVMDKSGIHVVSPRSAALPTLSLPELNRFLDQRSSLDETTLLRTFRDWVRSSFPEARS